MFQLIGNNIKCFKNDYIVLDIIGVEDNPNQKLYFVTNDEKTEIKDYEIILQPKEIGVFCYYIEMVQFDFITNIIIKGEIEVEERCQTY